MVALRVYYNKRRLKNNQQNKYYNNVVTLIAYIYHFIFFQGCIQLYFGGIAVAEHRYAFEKKYVRPTSC